MGNQYLEWLKDLHDAPIGTKDHNHWLCTIFPWLIPRNRFTDEIQERYDYASTELDSMPEGWKKAFGEDMCFEIKSLLEKTNFEYDYRILQIKEKFGELRWYDKGVPIEIEDEYQKILDKYTKLSRKVCIKCGKPATKISTGWVNPFCDECADSVHSDLLDIPSTHDGSFDSLIYDYNVSLGYRYKQEQIDTSRE